MKKLFALLLIAVILAPSFFVPQARAVEPSHLHSRTAVLMDAITGQVLYNKGMHQRVFPASTTKILTALLAVEYAHPHDVLTVSESALAPLPHYGAHIALVVGEMLTVEDAIYAMMLPSANDASNVLAEHIAGDLESFARMMTERAHAIGAVNSNFTNAHGLHEDNHYTTAYDMALITRHAMKNPEFMRYFGAAHRLMPATNMNSERNLHQFQLMVVPDVDGYDPRATGGKVGFTNAARHTMSTTAYQDGRHLVCVVMYSSNRWDKFFDTYALLNFGFDEFAPLTVRAEDFSGTELPVIQDEQVIGSAVFESGGDFNALVHISADPAQLQTHPNSPGYFDYAAPGRYTVIFELPTTLPFVPNYLGTVILTPTVDIPTTAAGSLALEGHGRYPAWIDSLIIAGLAFGGFLLLFLLFVAYRRHQIRRRRRRRMERLERKRAQEALRTEQDTRRSRLPRIPSRFPQPEPAAYNRRRAR